MNKIENWNLDSLYEKLQNKYNLDLSNYAAASLERRIERFLSLHPFEDVVALTQKLLNDVTFFDLFVQEITVNTTEMFRDPQCWNSIRTEILKHLKEFPSIRIWHAGCSSGEEVFSMAILLKEEGLYHKAKMVASDLNKEVILNATKGKYSLKSMPLNEENYIKSGGRHALSDYYTTKDSDVIMDPYLLENVKFLKHDLSAGSSFSKFDMILCRNVMIYFNKTLQERVFHLFHQSLFKKGFVVIGKKETMSYYENFRSFSEYDSIEKIYQLI
ncbi:chemotaxis protein CheR [Sphingobacteriaceae bacterium]|nr:chemotaxis protein CheR [Sphingobacteriaceae bacterium]